MTASGMDYIEISQKEFLEQSIQNAGLRIIEFAPVIEVSSQTIYNITGKTQRPNFI